MTSTSPATEDVETRFELALQYINKGGLAAQHAGQSPPSNEVLLEYYALVLFLSPTFASRPLHVPTQAVQTS